MNDNDNKEKNDYANEEEPVPEEYVEPKIPNQSQNNYKDSQKENTLENINIPLNPQTNNNANENNQPQKKELIILAQFQLSLIIKHFQYKKIELKHSTQIITTIIIIMII